SCRRGVCLKWSVSRTPRLPRARRAWVSARRRRAEVRSREHRRGVLHRAPLAWRVGVRRTAVREPSWLQQGSWAGPRPDAAPSYGLLSYTPSLSVRYILTHLGRLRGT